MPTNIIDYTNSSYSSKQFETAIEVEFVHNLKELYRRIHEWLQVNDWHDMNGKNWYEVQYWQRTGADKITEHNFWWRAWQHPGRVHGGPPQEAFIWLFQIEIQTIRASTTKALHQGKQWSSWQSNSKVYIKGYLILNYLRWFKGSSFLNVVKDRFSEWVYRRDRDFQEGQLRKKGHELANVIKAFLELRRREEPPPDIHPPSELPIHNV